MDKNPGFDRKSHFLSMLSLTVIV